MAFSIEGKDGHGVVSIDGDLDSAEVQDLRPRLDPLIAEGRPLVFDLSKVEFIDSSGIGLIVHAFKSLGVKRAKVAVAGASEQPLELLRATQLDRHIAFRPTVAEAAAAIG